MLTKKEQLKYLLEHQKQLQEQSNESIKLSNEESRKFDKESKELDEKYYKLLKKANPNKKIKKRKPFKSKLLKKIKIDEKYISKNFMGEHASHKEQINKIDLTPYLKKIRNKNVEYEIFLLIRDNKVIKEYTYTSNLMSKVGSIDKIKIVEKAAKKYKAGIYHVHNHPFSVVASPSTVDYMGYSFKLDKYKKEGFKFIDFGVVTFDDYYSYKQARRKTNKIIEIAKKDGVTNELALDLIDITFMVHKDYYLYKRGKRHPNYHIPRDKHKEELIKSTSFKEYKQLQKQARNEVNKIIKEHPEYAF